MMVCIVPWAFAFMEQSKVEKEDFNILGIKLRFAIQVTNKAYWRKKIIMD